MQAIEHKNGALEVSAPAVFRPSPDTLLAKKNQLRQVQPLEATPNLVSTNTSDMKAPSSIECLRHLEAKGIILTLPEPRLNFNLDNQVYGITNLHQAALRGSATAVTRLLRKGVPVNSVSYSCQTALHFAVTMKQDLVVSTLLHHGANINIKDQNGCDVKDLCQDPGRSTLRKLITAHESQSLSREKMTTSEQQLQNYREHQGLAQKALQYVQSVNVRSTNRASHTAGLDQSAIVERNRFIQAVRGALPTQPALPVVRAALYKAQVARVGAIAEQLQQRALPMFGNCGELAYLVLDYLAKQPHPTLEVAILDGEHKPVLIEQPVTHQQKILPAGPDHAFAVIGRDVQRTDPRDPGTWGFDTVICDPWAGRSYSADEMPEQLQLIPAVSGGATHTSIKLTLTSDHI